ncbi:MAG: hypothetical protein M3P18_04120 [Actinomycetota bacterium]|nr:hypothetical protein [Actinomycetota bacterium]
MRSRHLAAPVVATAIVAGSLLTAAPPIAHAAIACGVERWAVKTLSDAAASSVDYHARHVTVDHLRGLPAPSVGTYTPRIRPYEYRSYRIHVRLKAAVLEDDHDIHVVVAQPHHRRHTMILELPDTHCQGAAGSIKRHAMWRSRRRFIAACGTVSSSFRELHGRAIVKGVAFFDINHGQTGVAPNAIELHPLLRFRPRGNCT